MTELRPEWLRGQVTDWLDRQISVTERAPQTSMVLGWIGFMGLRRSIFGRNNANRALAIFACLMLLYFAGGGSLLHQHTNNPETPCHICQSLHVPVLAAASLDLVGAPELIARYSTIAQHAAPSDCSPLHRASRAPPTA